MRPSLSEDSDFWSKESWATLRVILGFRFFNSTPGSQVRSSLTINCLRDQKLSVRYAGTRASQTWAHISVTEIAAALAGL